jgi:hypothetical protein
MEVSSMRVRTQLAIVAVIAAGWSAGNVAVVHPVLAEPQQGGRERLGELESAVARDGDNVQAARELCTHYLAQDQAPLLVSTVARMSAAVQQDGRVSLLVARAQEKLGELQAASARLDGALNRCASYQDSQELAAAAGCDVQTQTQLAIEATAVDRMIRWHITPETDPEGAAFARELATRPIHFAAMR